MQGCSNSFWRVQTLRSGIAADSCGALARSAGDPPEKASDYQNPLLHPHAAAEGGMSLRAAGGRRYLLPPGSVESLVRRQAFQQACVVFLGAPMFYLQYRVLPSGTSPRREQLGEGLVCCWIDRLTLREADRVARRTIQREHWEVLE